MGASVNKEDEVATSVLAYNPDGMAEAQAL